MANFIEDPSLFRFAENPSLAMGPGGAGGGGGGGFMAGADKLFSNPSFLYLLSSLGQSLSTPGGYPEAMSKMGMGISQNIMGQEMLKQLLNSLRGGTGGGGATSGLGTLSTPVPGAGLDLSAFKFGQPPAQKSWLEADITKPILDFGM